MRTAAFIVTLALTAQLLYHTNSAWCAEDDQGKNVEIVLSEEYPVKGRECSVTIVGVSDSTASGKKIEVWVTYRPNSLVPKLKRLSGKGGVFRWTPEDAGICTIMAVRTEAGQADRAQGQSVPQSEKLAEKNVAVRFGGVPPTGVIIFLIAGVTLFGGMIWSMRKLMKAS